MSRVGPETAQAGERIFLSRAGGSDKGEISGGRCSQGGLPRDVVGGGFDLEDYLDALLPVSCPCIAFTVLKLTP